MGCPKCLFPGASILLDGSRRCAQCGNIFQSVIDFPDAPSRPSGAAPVAAGKRTFALVFVGIAVFVAIVGVFVALTLSRQSAPNPYREPPPRALTGQAETAAAAGPAQARINPQFFRGQNGDRQWWVLKYENTGDVPIWFPSVICEFRDANGKSESHVQHAEAAKLPAGEAIWMLVEPFGVGPHDAEFSVNGPKRATEIQPPCVRLQVDNVMLEANPDRNLAHYPFLTGTVTNNSGKRLQSVRVHGIGYDEQDLPCAYASGYAQTRKLGAGQTTEFRIGTGTWTARPPARWEAIAWGELGY